MKSPVKSFAVLFLFALEFPIRGGNKVSFVRDVEPILNKVGCTQGTCHGAAKGKNGFKLSLRGYDPEFDYRALIQDLSGRRFNRTDPGRSLMLLKPTAQVPHGGGLRFDSRVRHITRPSTNGSPRAPISATRSRPGHEARSHAARDAGSEARHRSSSSRSSRTTPTAATREVTKEAIYSSNTPTVADVDGSGRHQDRAQGRSGHAGPL